MRTVVIGAILILILGTYPIIAERDSYPHSHLPMFSVRRTELARIDTAIGITRQGNVSRLTPRLIADTDEVIMAKDAVVNAINSGTESNLCMDIAQRVGRQDHHVSRIRVVTETYDAIEWFYGIKEPEQIEIHAECDVR